MPKLEKIEGLTKEEFLAKARNNEKEFSYSETDDDTQRNKKDTMKMIYSPDRFIMSKMYHTADYETLTNKEKILQFVKASINGELPYYWETDNIPK